MLLSSKRNNLIFSIIILPLTIFILLSSCSKTPEELKQERLNINSKAKESFAEENYDKAIELAKESLYIAEHKLKNNEMVLETYIILLEIFLIKNQHEEYYNYSSKCFEISDKITINEQTELLISQCVKHYVKANMMLGQKFHEENILDKALFHLDKVIRAGEEISSFYNQFVARYFFSEIGIDLLSVYKDIRDINEVYLKSLPKNTDYISNKPVVMFILDASGSMYGIDSNGNFKIDTAKDTIIHAIKKLNTKKVNTSLMTFNKGCEDIDLLVSPKNTESSKVINKIKLIYPASLTPLAKSIQAAGEVLKNTNQYTRLVVVSDGNDTCNGEPIKAVKELKEQYGINVEVFTIGYSVDSSTKYILQQMAEAGGGEYFNVENDTDFTEAFNNIIPPEDRDSDWDGILNKLDNCPGTPKGMDVDSNGCSKTYEFKVNFNSGEATLENDSLREVVNFSTFLNNNPNIKVSIEGHTDSIGSELKNLQLSINRATTIRDKLIELGINQNRLSIIGFGEKKPLEIGSHDKNRRVEARLLN